MAALRLLHVDDPMMLVDIIGLPDQGSHLLAQRLAHRAICAPTLRPPTPADIAATPAAARPDAALWLLTPHALRDHRTSLEQSLPDGPGTVLPPIAERILARAELSCLFSALEHVQIATAHWVLPAVYAGIPLLPALLGTAAASIAASAGVEPDTTLAAWLASRGIHVTAGFAPVYDDSTRASVAIKFETRRPLGTSHNYPTDPAEVRALEGLIAAEVRQGWLVRLPDSALPVARKPAPLNVVPKAPDAHGRPRWRMITDDTQARQPFFDGHSVRPAGVNASVASTELAYPGTPSLGRVAAMLLGPHPPTMLATLDVSSGFKRIRLAAASSTLFTVRFKGTTYISSACSMGGRHSSTYMNSCTAALAQALESPGAEKSSPPARSVEWVGLRLTTGNDRGPAHVRMKDGAVVDLVSALTAAANGDPDRDQLAKVVGRITWFSTLCKPIRPLLRDIRRALADSPDRTSALDPSAAAAARALLTWAPGIARPLPATFAARATMAPDPFPAMLVVTDASAHGFGIAVFDLRLEPTLDATLAFLEAAPKIVRAILAEPSRLGGPGPHRMAQPGVRIAGYPLPLGYDDWAVAPLLCFWSGSSIQITAAFRFFASVARQHGAGLPFGRTAGASVTSTFLRASATRPQPLATSTLASYYHNVLRLADLMLSPIDSHATSRLVSLATKRIHRWGNPTRDSRGVFSRDDVLRAIRSPATDPAVAAAIAVCWDTLSRAGSLLTRPAPASTATPIPRANARVSLVNRHIHVQIDVFEKMSRTWERLHLTTDPDSPHYNPAHVGGAAAAAATLARPADRSSPLWLKRNRQPVSASDLVAALLAANPYLRQHRISPHSFRISAATWLLRHSSVTKDRIVLLGRWRNAQSVESYFRESASAHLLSSANRSAMP
ncbi:hypothetical protein FNF29_08462 [Cafeteria roenbergensis]|uniref:Reverse transcriptase domain-containing protein n=1 Tax=Cafeteria roenbergensis TaxID=33653 RepID=A0A5A8BZD0_CAFRO|nr:hypothetical protein FNF29_08462 [Cafeteria roenbergensis]|eukprot:KAA0145609.1 hypothetical protein FNF29_08462 [Cafeteria roenbergensis]